MHRFNDDVLEALTGERGIGGDPDRLHPAGWEVQGGLGRGLRRTETRQLTHDRRPRALSRLGPVGTEIAFTTFKRGNPDLYLF